MVVSRLLQWLMNHGLLYHINREEMIKTKYSIFHFITPNNFCLVRYRSDIRIIRNIIPIIIWINLGSSKRHTYHIDTYLWNASVKNYKTFHGLLNEKWTYRTNYSRKYIPYKLKPLSFWECVSVDQKKKRKMEEFIHKPLSAYTKFGYYDSCYIWLNYFACKKFCSILFWMDGWNIAFVPICPL